MAFGRAQYLSRLHIPDLERAIIRCRDDPPAVRAESADAHRIRMTFERAQHSARLRIPDLERAVIRSRDDPPAVWAESAAAHLIQMAFERADQGRMRQVRQIKLWDDARGSQIPRQFPHNGLQLVQVLQPAEDGRLQVVAL